VADGELRKLALTAGDRPIEVADVEALVADVRPASVNAVANAVERRDGRRAADALGRALDEGEPVLRIMAALEARLADMIAARDLMARGATPAELTKRLRPGNPTAAGKIATAARRFSGAELEAMLTGLFEADLAIKTQTAEPEAALAAWLGTHVLGAEPVAAEA
jgi:DNA polymerase III delta subunit